MKWWLFFLFTVTSFPYSFSQTVLSGTIKSKNGEPVFAANVYSKSNPQKGVTTDFEGNFSLKLETINDTLVVSFIGFETKVISLASMNLNETYMTIF